MTEALPALQMRQIWDEQLCAVDITLHVLLGI